MTALRVANVPVEQFEAVVESDAPPTVTKLADWGRKPQERPTWADAVASEQSHPKYHAANVQLMGFARRLAEFCDANRPDVIAPAIAEHNRRELRTCVAQVRRYMKTLAPLLRN